MSLRTVLIVVLALVCGISAAAGINMLRNAPLSAPEVEKVPVVMVALDVPRFTTITSEMLKTREFPKDSVPSGTLSKVEDVVDRVTLTHLGKDEWLTDTKVAAKGVGRGMAPAIAKGMRAFTILTPNVSSGVAGFILPGNKVDIYLTVSGIDASGGTESILLLQDVEILAVDQRVDAPNENKVDANQLRSVTLLTAPEQAMKLTLAQNKGQLHLALRNPGDRERLSMEPTTMADLGLSRDKPRPDSEPSKVVPTANETAAPPELPPVRIRTMRGMMQGTVVVE